jgi:hypothetical protein
VIEIGVVVMVSFQTHFQSGIRDTFCENNCENRSSGTVLCRHQGFPQTVVASAPCDSTTTNCPVHRVALCHSTALQMISSVKFESQTERAERERERRRESETEREMQQQQQQNSSDK